MESNHADRPLESLRMSVENGECNLPEPLRSATGFGLVRLYAMKYSPALISALLLLAAIIVPLSSLAGAATLYSNKGFLKGTFSNEGQDTLTTNIPTSNTTKMSSQTINGETVTVPLTTWGTTSNSGWTPNAITGPAVTGWVPLGGAFGIWAAPLGTNVVGTAGVKKWCGSHKC